MGQQARHGRGLRQDRQKASRRIRSRNGNAGASARSAKADRAVADPTDEALARGFVLQGYDPTTDDLRIELHLKPLPIERLRAMFDVGDDLELANAYPLDPEHAQALQDAVSEKIDTEKYAFFLQRYA